MTTVNKLTHSNLDGEIIGTYNPTKIVNGRTDRILWIDLFKKSIKIETISEEMKELYHGGRGFAVKILYDKTSNKIKPLDPENILIIATGPMTGEYRWPGGTKSVAAALAPATGGYGEASFGGKAGEKLKKAGFDVICVTGKLKNPSILVIDSIKGEIRLEKDTGENNAIELGKSFIEKYGKKYTAAITIGIGGRKRVKFACINGLHAVGKHYIPRQAGRTGIGAVMGSKNLLGIIPIGRDIEFNIADPKTLKIAARKLRKVITENDSKQLNLADVGTSSLVEIMQEYSILPIRNFRSPKDIDGEVKGLHALSFKNDVFKKSHPCSPGCNLMCGKISSATLKDGTEVTLDGPEYESIGMLGSNIGVFDAKFVARLNYLCDIYGIDTISTGAVIAYSMECYEKGFLTKEMTGNIPLEWGDKEMIEDLVDMIAERRGFGDILANGIKGVIDFIAKGDNETIDTLNKFAVQSKGLECSAYRSTMSIAMQLAYSTSLIGAHHREAWMIFIDAVKNEIPSIKDKCEMLVWFQNIRTWVDIAGFCKLQWIDVRNPESKGPKNLPSVDLYILAINAVTGLNWTMEEHFEVSKRVYTLAKMINLSRGLTRKDDRMSERTLGNVTWEKFDEILDKYYEMRGWDKKGIPSEETLIHLKLK